MRDTAEQSAPIAEVQAVLTEMAERARDMDRQMAALLATLPPSDDYLEPMLDWEIPPTMEAELFTALECIRYEILAELIRLLEKEARMTPETVQAEWRERQAASGQREEP